MRLWPDLSLDRIEVLPPEGLARLPDTLWAFIWFFVRQIKGPFLLTACLFGLGNIAFTIEPVFIGKIIGGISDAARTGMSPHDALPGLISIAVVYLLIVQVGGRLCWQFGHGVEIRLFPIFAMLIRRQLAIYLHGHSYRYFQDDFAGRLSGKIVEMPQAIHLVAKMLLNQFLFTAINLTFATALLISVNWRFGLCAIVYVTFYISFLTFFVPRIQTRAQTSADARHVLRGQFVDTVSNVLLVKLFARLKFEDRRFLGAVKSAGSAEAAENRIVYALYRCQHCVNAVFQASIITIAIYAWQAGAVGVRGIATAVPLSLQMVGNCWWLLENCAEFLSRLGEIKSGIESVVVAQDVTDRPDAKPIRVARGTIAFDNVVFSYPSRPVFDGFSLEIPAGQRLGLIGPSGAGKSTLMQLLLRLHDLQSGKISIDGQDISMLTQDSLRSAMAIIPQSSDLLHRTIRENISYGNLNAGEDQIIDAARKAQAHDFIMDLEDKTGGHGYDATVGERGVKLSGGQRQRVAIARAILKDAPILILDEATSSLDSESERLIQESLKELMKGRTVLAIAHRLSTIAHLDRLVVMDGGRIVEDGSHEELLARGGLYARLWGLQSGGFLGHTKRRETGEI